MMNVLLAKAAHAAAQSPKPVPTVSPSPIADGPRLSFELIIHPLGMIILGIIILVITIVAVARWLLFRYYHNKILWLLLINPYGMTAVEIARTLRITTHNVMAMLVNLMLDDDVDSLTVPDTYPPRVIYKLSKSGYETALKISGKRHAAN